MLLFGTHIKAPGLGRRVPGHQQSGAIPRASAEKAKLKAVIDQSKELLGIPGDYVLGIVPGSDTGAFEMAMWTMLGARGIDVLSWESFGQGWRTDITKQLKLEDVRDLGADYGHLPDLSTVDFSRDVIFTWNGTTSGVRVPNADWIPADREGSYALRCDFCCIRYGNGLLETGCCDLVMAESPGR